MNSEIMETSKAILSELAAVDSGAISELPIAWDLYPQESLRAAIEIFAVYCEIVSRQVSAECSAVASIRVRDEHRRDSRKIIGRFLSFLLDHATRTRLRMEAET
jgi:hypothetical protein